MADKIYVTSDTGWSPYYVEDTAGKEILNGKKVTKLYFKVITTYALENKKPVANSAVSELYYSSAPAALGGGQKIAEKGAGEKWKSEEGITLGAATAKALSNSGSNLSQDLDKNIKAKIAKDSKTTTETIGGNQEDAISTQEANTLVGKPPQATPESETPPGGANGPGGDSGGGSVSITPEDSETTKKLISTSVKARTTYQGSLNYPEAYDGNDFTIIRMIRYVPDPNISLGGNTEVGTTGEGDTEAVTNLSLTRFSERNKEILATINLPIPSNLVDSNPVSWENGDLGPLKAYGVTAAANILNSGNFATALGNEVGRAAKTVQANSAAARTVLNASIVGAVLGMSGNDLLQRSTGAILNPNTELLFRGPQLRTWNFSFKMTPRNEKESQAIKRIIRWIKQGASVKRAGNGIFLASPNVFEIEFQHIEHDGKNTGKTVIHPYLPRVKPAALQNISVNYMPDGSYMTYGNGSMVAYEMTLSFQEIEPIFDEDYDKLDGANGQDSTIGF